MKNVLFIAPIFFDYEKAIASALNQRHRKVIFKCEVPFDSPVKFYALRRIMPAKAQKELEKYNRSLTRIVEKEKIDTVFIIRGYGILPEFLTEIKIINPAIEIINYQWDSLKSNPNGKIISKYADKNISFDLADCDMYPEFTHLPLFYDWESIGKKRIDPNECVQDIDILFVGAYYPERYAVLEKVKKECERQRLNLYAHIYHPFGSFVRKMFSSERIKRSAVSFHPVSRREYYNLICRTKAVIDIQNVTQTGATIRTIETLSLGRKLISTNTMLKREKFYSPDNIMIWNISEKLNITDFIAEKFDTKADKYIMNTSEWLSLIGL